MWKYFNLFSCLIIFHTVASQEATTSAGSVTVALENSTANATDALAATGDNSTTTQATAETTKEASTISSTVSEQNSTDASTLSSVISVTNSSSVPDSPAADTTSPSGSNTTDSSVTEHVTIAGSVEAAKSTENATTAASTNAEGSATSTSTSQEADTTATQVNDTTTAATGTTVQATPSSVDEKNASSVAGLGALSRDLEVDPTPTKKNSATTKAAAARVNKPEIKIPTSGSPARAAAAPTGQKIADPQNFGVQTNARWQPITEMNVQSPSVWDALTQLRGKSQLSSVEMSDLLASAVPGVDYPNYKEIPQTSFSCEKVNQPGFYADPEAKCQVIRRCDINAMQWSYLCPNATLFNQITLTCEWYLNVDCSKAEAFYDYSNRRLYNPSWALLTDAA